MRVVGRAAQRVPMYLETLQVRHGQVFGSQGHSGDGILPSVIRMMASGRLDMTQMITARYDLAKTGSDCRVGRTLSRQDHGETIIQ